MKNRRSEGKKSKTKASVTRNKIKAVKRELGYAGGKRIEFLNERLQFWEGKS